MKNGVTLSSEECGKLMAYIMKLEELELMVTEFPDGLKDELTRLYPDKLMTKLIEV